MYNPRIGWKSGAWKAGCKAVCIVVTNWWQTETEAIAAWNHRAQACDAGEYVASLKIELAAALADLIAYRRVRYADSAPEEARYLELTGHAYDDKSGGA